MLIDCAYDDAELIVVEGRSAADAVNVVRDRRRQAVFALQGKIPNSATPSGARRAHKHKHLRFLLELLQPEKSDSKFSRVLLLCDADADGLHARALLTTFFQTVLPALVQQRMIYHVYPPLFQLSSEFEKRPTFGWRATDLQQLRESGVRHGQQLAEITYYKGIASMPSESLHTTCISAESRIEHLLTPADEGCDY